MSNTVIENILLIGAFVYMVSAVVRLVESRYKPSPEEERRKRLAVLYGRDE
tara:strand:+ start:736 stop:888 length:153 start_codon:yes stop_codon:yes gene_type:complete